MTMLEGIRIIDLTTVIFGPYATQMLADLGAEVIKVETPGLGDVSRYLGSGVPDPTMGSIHLTVNRGKRSIALDLKDPDDAAVLRGLIAGADVFFHNVRGKAIARLGFDYESCRAIKPDIIYVHGTGFGQDGPYADLQAYDDVRFRSQRVHARDVFRLREICDDRFLAAVASVIVCGIARAIGIFGERRAPGAGVVAGRAFDLDHLRPQIGEQLSRPWPREDAGEFEHLDAGQRSVLIHRHPLPVRQAGV